MPVRRANPNRVKLHRSYSVEELARCLDVHKNTVRHWQAKGLEPIDRGRPVLFQGASVRSFLAARNSSRKQPCTPGTLYCFRCRSPRAPALGMVDFVPILPGSGNLRALCECCETIMHRRVREADIAAIMPGCTVQFAQGQPRLSGQTAPSLNCDSKRQGYAVRAIADLVPNYFVAWDIVIALVRGLGTRGWDDALIGRLSAFLIAELRVDLAAERDRQAETLFAAGLDSGAIRFGLRGGDSDWIAPAELWTTLPEDSPWLRASNDKQLERSLFLPIYVAELNDSERKFAVYLDRDDAVRWWHRNGSTPKNYGLRGWRRGNVYPDFLFAALQDGTRDRVVVIETKGEQLAGNPDTEYKRALLSLLSDKFNPMPPQGGGLGLEDQAFDFSAAVVLFGELDAKLPAVIRGGEQVGKAVQA